MISYDDMIRRITLTCSTAALVPRVVCSCIALSCAAKKYVYRPVPSWKQKCTVPCRREKKTTVPSGRGRNYIPSRPVVKNYIHRPVPSSKNMYTVPSRHETKRSLYCTVPSRPVEKIHTHRSVPSHPGNYNFHYFTVPSRAVFKNFPPNFSKQHSPIPSRILPAMKSLEKYETRNAENDWSWAEKNTKPPFKKCSWWWHSK